MTCQLVGAGNTEEKFSATTLGYSRVWELTYECVIAIQFDENVLKGGQ